NLICRRKFDSRDRVCSNMPLESGSHAIPSTNTGSGKDLINVASGDTTRIVLRFVLASVYSQRAINLPSADQATEDPPTARSGGWGTSRRFEPSLLAITNWAFFSPASWCTNA